jgi:hypothetical protein
MTQVNERNILFTIIEKIPKLSPEWKAGITGGLIMSTIFAYPAALAINSIVTYCKEFLR